MVPTSNIRKKIFSFFVGLIIAVTSAHAAGSEDILGVWNTEGKDAKIMIFRCGEK